MSRLQANRSLPGSGITGGDAGAPATADEKAFKAEEERLASPLTTTQGLSTGGTTSQSEANSESGNAFLDAAAARSFQTAWAKQLANVDRLIPQGTILPAILETGISSDLPGQLRARISRDVWSADATAILIPKGSTLVGEYSSDVSLGQSRVLVAWNRVITTDQRSIMIGSRGVDALGRAGLTGNVQHHFALKFEAAFFISIFSGISNLSNNTLTDNTSGLSTGTDSLGSAGQSALEEYLSISPSIWVQHGDNINVFVSRDLYL